MPEEHKDNLADFGVTTKISQNKGLYTRKYISSIGEISKTKAEARQKINNSVIDIHDSVANNNKMILLLVSMLIRLYNGDFDKNNLSDEDKQLMEYTFNKYMQSMTRLDLDFIKKGGIETIDALIDSQNNIASVINGIYKIVDESTEDS